MDLQEKLKIEYLRPEDLTPYENNARAHTETDIAAICESIKDVGFSDPIGIWGPENIIVEGHGRLLAAKKLGLEKVPVIRLDHMTDEQRREYALTHNKTAELSAWDFTRLQEELEKLRNVDMSRFGFEELRQKNHEWFENRETWDDSREEGNDEYNDFLDKFEAKKTTDDCYTPANIYEAIADYVSKKYGVQKERFRRPFYPGGDYQAETYTPGDVVVDNPPFSILAEIVSFYVEKGVKFFLFSPGLTMLSHTRFGGVCAICICAKVTYENGADVNTGFLTNLGDEEIMATSCPELHEIIEKVNNGNLKAMHRQLPKYSFPYEVITAAKLGWLSKYGERLEIRRDEAQFIRSLDAMKEGGKGNAIFGGGLLLSERAAAERAAAERAAAERAAAETYALSEREMEIVRGLGKKS